MRDSLGVPRSWRPCCSGPDRTSPSRRPLHGALTDARRHAACPAPRTVRRCARVSVPRAARHRVLRTAAAIGQPLHARALDLVLVPHAVKDKDAIERGDTLLGEEERKRYEAYIDANPHAGAKAVAAGRSGGRVVG